MFFGGRQCILRITLSSKCSSGHLRGFATGVAIGKRRRRTEPIATGSQRTAPAYVGVRDLAKILDTSVMRVFRALGGVKGRRRFHLPLLSGPHTFPSMGAAIVPFDDACKAADVLGKELIYQETEPPMPSKALRGATDKPVVVLLGHFNHGKTTLLDAFLGEGSAIAASERCGITQEIRARTGYIGDITRTKDMGQADVHTSRADVASTVTFLDTPGQDIFHRMRLGGASVADLAVLAVSAELEEGGIREQTGESVGCLEELGLKAVVALTKMDLVPDNIKEQRIKSLTSELHEFVSLDSASIVPVSATTGYGLDRLRAAIRVALAETIQHPENDIETTENRNIEEQDIKYTREFSQDTSFEADQPLVSHTTRKNALKENTSTENNTIENRKSNINETREKLNLRSGDIPTSTLQNSQNNSQKDIISNSSILTATGTVLDYVNSSKNGQRMLVLVHSGVLKVGTHFVSGTQWGVVRSIKDELNKKTVTCGIRGEAVQLTVKVRNGSDGASIPLGEPFHGMKSDKDAENAALVRLLCRDLPMFESVGRDRELLEGRPPLDSEESDNSDSDWSDDESIDQSEHEKVSPTLTFQVEEPELYRTAIVLKADTAHSLAALLDSMEDMPDVQVVSSRVGTIACGDIRVAVTAKCPVFAFNTQMDKSAKTLASTLGIKVVMSETVQDVLDNVLAFHDQETERQLRRKRRQRRGNTHSSASKTAPKAPTQTYE